MRYRSSFLLVFLSLVLGVSGTRAQQAPTVVLPDSIVITASRYAEDVRLTGRRMTVLTAKDIAMQPVSTLDELLRTAGGVEIQSRGGFGVQSDVTMRGSSFNGVLVLIDGARVNDPMTGHFLADIPIPLSEVARVEILRGPATALYGPDAIGGVIQIFTYTGLQQSGLNPSTDASLELQRGQFDLYNIDGALRHATRRSAFGLATTWQASDGMEVTTPAGQVVTRSGTPVRTDFSRQAHTAAYVRQLGSASLFARAGYDARDFGAYHYYTAFPSDTARESTSTLWAQIRLQGSPTARTQWQAQIAAKEHGDEYVYNPVTPANIHTSRFAFAHLQLMRAVSEKLTVMGGVTGSFRSIDSNNLGVHSDPATGAFVSARWQPLLALTVNASGRLDYDPGYGLEPTPQVSAAYNLAGATLRAGISRAVREPNYVERYNNTTLAQPRGKNLGNPDLKPESAWAYEAGVDLYPAPGLSLHGTGFIRYTDNLIDYAKITVADTVWLARNLLNVETRGLEVDAAYNHWFGDSRLRLDGSYTRLYADLGATEGAQFKYALTNARHLLQGGASLDLNGLLVGATALWKDRLEGVSYGTVNARLGYRLALGRQRLVFSGEVRNVFDLEYSEIFDAPMPGRWWIFGVKLVR